MKEEIITLCGSTKFKDKFEYHNKRLSLLGKVVFSCSCFGHADNLNLPILDKRTLDEVHLKKIDLSEAIYVINFRGYIGNSTKKEIEYAKNTGKKIYYLEKVLSISSK